ncbi:hypothetical protein COB21_04920 [Candidatus Aerophobetes bacterium]|uniref:Uncharacterized protein n=1 Tax=Aerophobetes bacterium TaxID=2030807 RepID=A0A2A4X0N7_UNCAE|nr:MAG: hypothetical protein COB21_04920 [Candidatus Aerophobetes bacterium]
MSSPLKFAIAAASAAALTVKYTQQTSYTAGIRQEKIVTLVFAMGTFTLISSVMYANKRGNPLLAVNLSSGVLLQGVAVIAQIYRQCYVPKKNWNNWCVVTVKINDSSILRNLSGGKEVLSAALKALANLGVASEESANQEHKPLSVARISLVDLLAAISVYGIPTALLVSFTARHLFYVGKDIVTKNLSIRSFQDLVLTLPGIHHLMANGLHVPLAINDQNELIISLDGLEENTGPGKDSRFCEKMRLFSTWMEPYTLMLEPLINTLFGSIALMPINLVFLALPHMSREAKNEVWLFIEQKIYDLALLIASLFSPSGKDLGTTLGADGVRGMRALSYLYADLLQRHGISSPFLSLQAHQQISAALSEQLVATITTTEPKLPQEQLREAVEQVMRAGLTLDTQTLSPDSAQLGGKTIHLPIGPLQDLLFGNGLSGLISLAKQAQQAQQQDASEEQKVKAFQAEGIRFATDLFTSFLRTLFSAPESLALPHNVKLYASLMDPDTFLQPKHMPTAELTRTDLEQIKHGDNVNGWPAHCSFTQLYRHLESHSYESEPKWFKNIRNKTIITKAISVCQQFPQDEYEILASLNYFFYGLILGLQNSGLDNTVVKEVSNDEETIETLERFLCNKRTKLAFSKIGSIGRLSLTDINQGLGAFLLNSQDKINQVRRETSAMQALQFANLLEIFSKLGTSGIKKLKNSAPTGVPSATLSVMNTFPSLFVAFAAFARDNATNLHRIDAVTGKYKPTEASQESDKIANARVLNMFVNTLLERLHHPNVEYLTYDTLLHGQNGLNQIFADNLLTDSVKENFTSPQDQMRVLELALAIVEREHEIAIYQKEVEEMAPAETAADEEAKQKKILVLDCWKNEIQHAKTLFDALLNSGSVEQTNDVMNALFASSMGQEAQPLPEDVAPLSPTMHALMYQVRSEPAIAARAGLLFKARAMDGFMKNHDALLRSEGLLDFANTDAYLWHAMSMSPESCLALQSSRENLARLVSKAKNPITEPMAKAWDVMGNVLSDHTTNLPTFDINDLSSMDDPEYVRGEIQDALEDEGLTSREFIAIQNAYTQQAKLWIAAVTRQQNQVIKTFNIHLGPAIFTQLELAKPDTAPASSVVGQEMAHKNVTFATQSHVDLVAIASAQNAFEALLTQSPHTFLQTELELDARIQGTMETVTKIVAQVIQTLIAGMVFETDSYQRKNKELSERTHRRQQGEESLRLHAHEVDHIMRNLSDAFNAFPFLGFIPQWNNLRAILKAGYPAGSITIPMARRGPEELWTTNPSDRDNLDLQGRHGQHSAKIREQLETLRNTRQELHNENKPPFEISMYMLYGLLKAITMNPKTQAKLQTLYDQSRYQEKVKTSNDAWIDGLHSLANSDHSAPDFIERCEEYLQEIQVGLSGTGSVIDTLMEMVTLFPDIVNMVK